MVVFPLRSTVHTEADIAIFACEMVAANIPTDHLIAFNAHLKVWLLDILECLSVLTL
jgi:hypothetical protein